MITHSGQTLPRIHKHELNIIQAATAVIPVLVNLLCLCSCNAGDALALAPDNNVVMDRSIGRVWGQYQYVCLILVLTQTGHLEDEEMSYYSVNTQR